MFGRILRIGPVCYHVKHLLAPMVAHEMNFFYDEGLHDEYGNETYEIVPHGLAPMTFEKETLAQAMKEKGVDIAFDVQTRTALYLNSQGEDLYTIASWRNQRGGSLVAEPSVKQIEDLRGKRIGIGDINDNQHLAIGYLLLQAGVDPHSEVEWVLDMRPEARLKPLLERKIDAAIVHRDHGAQLCEQGFTLLMDKMASAYPKGRPDRVIVATGQVLTERPQEVKAFLRGILRAYWFVRDREHFQYMYQLERRLRRRSPDYQERRRASTVSSPNHLEDDPVPLDGLPTGLEEYAAEMIALGELDGARVNIPKACRLELVREAFAELAARPEMAKELERARKVVRRVGH